MSYCVTEGNAVADATLRQTSGGKQVANVVVRVDQRVRTGDGGFSDGPTIDYEITVWGKAAETFATKEGVTAAVGRVESAVDRLTQRIDRLLEAQAHHPPPRRAST